MNLLSGHRVIALETAAHSPLARLLESFGAQLLPTTRAEMLDALSEESFLIEEVGLHNLERAGLGRDRIEELNPSLIHVSVTTFGSEGPRAHWRGGELIASATGGTLLLTGEPDRPPVKEALDACGFHANMVAASGLLAAHYERSISGRGQHVDVSVQQVAASRLVSSILAWQFDRRRLHRVGAALNYGLATVRCIWELADGWCFHTLMTGRFGAPANQALSHWMDEAGVANPLHGTDWLRYNRSTLDASTRERWEAAMAAFFLTRTRADIAGEGRRRGINATVLMAPADVLQDEHLRTRGFWKVRGDHLEPSRFVQVTQTDSQEPPRSLPPPSSQRGGPLAGVRVLDFSWALVGSITTKTLGDLGADVIKVESRTRPCLTRIDVQVSASRPGNFDDKPWFAHLNTSKRSLALDMKKTESREILAPLLEWADIVVENFSPGTMAKLGLDYASLSLRNPRIVMVSGSVYGQTGPLSMEWGVDGTGGALSGRTYLTGWPDRGPLVPGAVPYGDVIVPYVMAGAAAAALQRRQQTGIGCHIDASMFEICVQQMTGALRAVQRGETPHRMGNTAAQVFRQGVYPAAGEDRWIAISCPSIADWEALCRLAGLEATVPDERLAQWTRGQDAHTLVQQLQDAGIAAGVVQDIVDLLERDPQLAARNMLVPLDHPLLGTFGHLATPLLLSRTALSPFRAPSIGEHCAQIAIGLAGSSEQRFEELLHQGVFE